MTLYRKKPVEVEAFQFTSGDVELPDWVPASVSGFFISDLYPDGKVRAQIQTLEGTMHADIGDWIIRGVKGEIYPCKPDIFELTYEKVSD